MPAQDVWYFATPQGERTGPVTYQKLLDRIQSGQMNRDDLVWADHLTEWTPMGQVPELAGWARQLPPTMPARPAVQNDQDIIESIKTFELVSAIVWCIIAGFQILAGLCTGLFGCALVAAGAWNVYAAVTRFQLVKKIQERRKAVVMAYESYTQLVVIGLINLFFGAFIGALWVIFDFVIRDKVLKNRHLFDQ